MTGEQNAERQSQRREQDQGRRQADQKGTAQGQVRKEVKPPPVVVYLETLQLKGEGP